MHLRLQSWRTFGLRVVWAWALGLVAGACMAEDLQEKGAVVAQLRALTQALSNMEVATVETIQPLTDVIASPEANLREGMFPANEPDLLKCLRQLLRMTQGSPTPDEIRNLLRRDGKDFVQECFLKVPSKGFERRYTYLSDGRVFFSVNHDEKRVSVTESPSWMGCSYPSLLTRVCDGIPGAGHHDGITWSSWLQTIMTSPNGAAAKASIVDGKVTVEVSESFKCTGSAEVGNPEIFQITRLQFDGGSVCPRRISRSLGRKEAEHELEYFAVECSDFRSVGEIELPYRFKVSELVERPLTKEELGQLKESKLPGLMWTMLIKRQHREIVVGQLSLLSVPADFLKKTSLPEGMELSDTRTGQFSMIDKAVFPFAN
jgi:hypothetical protein